jgi:hypothetical protein
MGDYNSYAPTILGEEWVPIRDENIFLSPVVNVVEQGHGFTIATSRTLQDGRFYLNQFPSADNQVSQAYQIAIYPRGTETLTGPVRTVDIPVNNGGITGNAFITGVNVADALYVPSDSNFITLSGGTPADANVDLYFATNAYAQLLNGKRILNVSLIYTAEFSANVPTPFNGEVNVYQVPNPYGVRYGRVNDGTISGPVAGPGTPVYTFIDMGEISPFWQTGDVNLITERLPWTYGVLQRFEFAAANRLTVRWKGFQNVSGTAMFLEYCAMRVTYCEEQRLIVGATQFGGFSSATLDSVGRCQFLNQTNIITMRSLPTFAASPVLTAGDYSLVLSAADVGAPDAKDSPYALLNALRELYDVPSHPGIQINLTQTVGDTFTKEPLLTLPQLSLHTSSGPLTEVHSYGRQIAAQVYGTITATQEIYDDISGVNASYPQVRYYARRFGNTTIPLTLTGTGIFTTSTASITPSAFDALDTIIDGWKEVNLRFSVAPLMGAATGTPGWTWSSPGELIGNRWEILGACAPAISGVPGNAYSLIPSPHQLTTTTYQPPVGSTVELTWAPQGIGSPPVSGMASDPTSDAVLMFSTDPPMISGFAIALTSQAVTGFTECTSGPCCIPTAIQYHHITWVNPGLVNDTFTRVVAPGGWGSADTGQAWAVTVGTAADFSVNGTKGVVSHPSTGSDHAIAINAGTTNQRVSTFFTLPTLPVGSGAIAIIDVYARRTDNSNAYIARVTTTTAGVMTLNVFQVVAGVGATIGTGLPIPLDVTHSYGIRLEVQGSMIRAKFWDDTSGTEPDWQIITVNSAVTSTGTTAQIFSFTGSATNLPYVFNFDNTSVIAPTFGAYELQRMDVVDTTWQTIMHATNPTTLFFNDYEARVGVLSSYRIRSLNVYDFAGLWSVTGTGTITEPGVTLPSCGTNKRGVLIFTSNESQTGAYNLAYAMTWPNTPVENFDFPEAGAVEFTEQFDRDFQVAFHGTERGGETFSRTLLLANAAIALPRLGNTHSLRDMAWADVPYICVRDDIGDRWFAAIIVPEVSVKRKRRLYNAPITVVEVTDTPSPVNP